MQPQARVDTGMPGNFTDDAFTTTGIFPSFALPTVKVSCDCTHVPPGQSPSLVHSSGVLSPPLHAGPNGSGIDRKSLAIATPLVPAGNAVQASYTARIQRGPGTSGYTTSCSVVQFAAQPWPPNVVQVPPVHVESPTWQGRPGRRAADTRSTQIAIFA